MEKRIINFLFVIVIAAFTFSIWQLITKPSWLDTLVFIVAWPLLVWCWRQEIKKLIALIRIHWRFQQDINSALDTIDDDKNVAAVVIRLKTAESQLKQMVEALEAHDSYEIALRQVIYNPAKFRQEGWSQRLDALSCKVETAKAALKLYREGQ